LDSDLKGEIEILMENFKRNDLIQKVVEIMIEKNPVEGIRRHLSQDAGAVVRLVTG
jgi:hypothetical protein